jgi:UDP-2,4-diacetamido-2,4,6-trideoxy-beta-L-altropyranose hydrolase
MTTSSSSDRKLRARIAMPAKSLLIRADASAEIGVGHAMRCLALAQAWRDKGGRVIFALGGGAEGIEERLCSESASVVRVCSESGSREDARETAQLCTESGADWMILDGFHFSQSYRESVKTDATRLLLLDDHGACAPYKCDIVLNTNPYAVDAMYLEREDYTVFLLGPQYALLRREFLAAPARSPDVSATARRVLITFGGGDPHNVTLRVVEALHEIHDVKLDITVVVGASNPHRALLSAALERSPHVARLLFNVDNMPEVMTQAELAISAGGGTCYELAIMQVPMFLITIASNHERTVEAYGRAQAALTGGWFDELGPESLAASLRSLIGDPMLRKELTENARRMVDGRGAQRVVDAMCSIRMEERIKT